MKDLCDFLRVSRSGFYRFLQRQTRPDRDADLKAQIQAIYLRRKGIYGYRHIQVELGRIFGLFVNHKRVFRVMRQLGLKANIRKKRRFFPNLYKAAPGGRVVENKLNREFHADQSNQKWVTDVTYIHAGNQQMYLSVIMDLFNNEIIAYHTSERNDNELVLKTVQKAVRKRGSAHNVILHSDRGAQYTSYPYHALLRKNNIQISMSRKGNCLDNACVESFFSHLKTESIYLHKPQNLLQAQKMVREYIRFYNNSRIQLKLNKLTPVEYRRQLVA